MQHDLAVRVARVDRERLVHRVRQRAVHDERQEDDRRDVREHLAPQLRWDALVLEDEEGEREADRAAQAAEDGEQALLPVEAVAHLADEWVEPEHDERAHEVAVDVEQESRSRRRLLQTM